MNDNRKELIPDLRFPEFVNDGEWRKKILGNFLNFQTGFPFESAGFNSDKIGVRLIKNRDLKSDDSIIFYKNSFDEKYIVSNGDVLIGMDGDFTPSIWKKGSALLNQRVGRIVTADKKNEVFFYYFLIIHLKKIEDLTPRTTVKHLSHSVVEKIFEPIPNANEQQKIASCLSSLDELITAQKEKLELLKNHKKGLMQNLFPQEGETVPKFRFPEFENDGEWEKKMIEDVAKVTTGNRDTQNKVEKGKYPFFVRSQTVEKINSFALNCEAILTSGDGVGVGRNFHYITGKFDFHQRVYCIYDFGKEISGHFVFMYFSQNFNERVMRMSAKNSVDSVRRTMITEMPILIPKRIEQQKIATCLSSLDELISSQTDKIEKLQLHKKGLMQGLFPKMID